MQPERLFTRGEILWHIPLFDPRNSAIAACSCGWKCQQGNLADSWVSFVYHMNPLKEYKAGEFTESDVIAAHGMGIRLDDPPVEPKECEGTCVHCAHDCEGP